MVTLVKGYDRLAVNHDINLDLGFNEGVGLVSRDQAGVAHREATLVGVPAWSQWPLSGVTYLNYGGVDYLECPAAETADLDYTAGDYTLACWIRHQWNAATKLLMGRYALDTDGWECYVTDSAPGIYYLTLRHHHASLAPNTRDGCYSAGWEPDIWWLMTITRHKQAGTSYPLHYRNGMPVDVTYDPVGLLDPDSAVRDLVIGVRFTKNANYWLGDMWRPRVWSRALEPAEVMMLFEMERNLFGV